MINDQCLIISNKKLTIKLFSFYHSPLSNSFLGTSTCSCFIQKTSLHLYMMKRSFTLENRKTSNTELPFWLFLRAGKYDKLLLSLFGYWHLPFQ